MLLAMTVAKFIAPEEQPRRSLSHVWHIKVVRTDGWNKGDGIILHFSLTRQRISASTAVDLNAFLLN